MPRYPAKPAQSVEPILVNVVDAAAMLGVGRSTVWELIKASELRAVKIHSRTLIHRDEIERYARGLLEAVS